MSVTGIDTTLRSVHNGLATIATALKLREDTNPVLRSAGDLAQSTLDAYVRTNDETVGTLSQWLSQAASAAPASELYRERIRVADQALTAAFAANGMTRPTARMGVEHLAASESPSSVGVVDDSLDTMGNVMRGHERGEVANDGQGFDGSGGAVDSTPGYNDYSDLF